MRKLLLALAIVCSLNLSANAQEFIFKLMDRTDITVQQAADIAQHYFDSVGTDRKTGYKHFQRWLYERKFHTDENGFFIDPKREHEIWEQSSPAYSRTDGTVSWTELGPWGWSYTSSWNPGTGRITDVSIPASDTTIIYVTSPGGGIWKSTNSGSTWAPLQDFNSTWFNMFAVTVDPSNKNIVYAGNASGNVEKTISGGTSWTTLSVGSFGAVRKILVHPTNSNIVFVCSSAGIHRSTDGGATWTLVHGTQKEDIEFKTNDPNIMIATGSSTIVRSIDNGVNWTTLGTAQGITNSGRSLVTVTPADPNVVYILQGNGSEFGRMYRSADAGATFTTTVIGSSAAGTNYFGYSPLGTDAGGQGTYDMALCASPIDANEVYLAGIIVWRSTNGGTSFVAQTVWSYPNSTGYNHADVHGLRWINNTLYSNSDGGIFKTLDRADNWTNISTGLGIRQFYRMALSQTDVNVITGGAQDNGSVTRKPAGNWADWLGADGMEGLVSPTNANNIWGTSQNGSIYYSTNGGNSYGNLSNPSSGNWVTPLAIHPTNQNTLYGGWTGFYKSTNGGFNWTKLSGSIIAAKLDDIAVAPSDTNYLYASTFNTLYVSTDAGATWATRPALSGGSISDICIHRTIPNKIYVTTDGGSNNVLVSTDAGATFTSISTGLPTVAARSIAIENDPLNGIYVGMNTGVYFKNDTMATWFNYTGNLPAVAVNELELQYTGRRVRVATYGRGIWETPFFADFVALPVKWLSFTAIKETNAVNLTWNVSGENASTKYEVEKSLDGVRFQKIGAANNRGLSTAAYQLTDNNPVKGIQYYRVKELTEGKLFYSAIVAVSFGEKQEQLLIAPNPVVRGNLHFSFAKGNTEEFEINVLDASGRVMLVHKQKDGIGNLNIGYMPSGTYTLIVKHGVEKSTAKFIKVD
jgi:Secretion system C-terminal sorting domain